MARAQPNPQPPDDPTPQTGPAQPAPKPLSQVTVGDVAAALAGLNGGRLATLRAIYEKPIRSDIPWRDIEALFKALGGTLTQGNGSRVRVALLGQRAVFHSPHPERVTGKGAVGSVRTFLINAGIAE